MSEWIEILIVAFTLQLAALPGEKGQFVIAALSTRYDPLVVVGAASLAFGGWTALEIWFGQALQGALSPVYLDLVTGALFVLFGALLLQSMPESRQLGAGPETDGGVPFTAADPDLEVLGVAVPDWLGGFVPAFALMAVGEFGDKTQLITIGLAVQYGAYPSIWAGEMLAIVPVSLANAYLFHRFSHRFDARKAHVAAAGLFFLFGAETFLELATGISVWETAVGAVVDVALPAL